MDYESFLEYIGNVPVEERESLVNELNDQVAKLIERNSETLVSLSGPDDGSGIIWLGTPVIIDVKQAKEWSTLPVLPALVEAHMSSLLES